MSEMRKDICRIRDECWEGRYIKERTDGKIKYGYVFGKTFDETKQKLKKIPVAVFSESIDTTFKFISHEWLCSRENQLCTSSISKYSNTLDLYIIPKFGDIIISDIRRRDVILFGNELLGSGGVLGTGLSSKTVNGVISVMKNVFDFALNEKLLTVANIRDISIRQPQKPLRILSLSEQQKFSGFLMDNLDFCHVGILICLYTGLRIGEICALRWEDINVDGGYLCVNKTMQRLQVRGENGAKTQIFITSPKSNCSIRKIPIPKKLLTVLTAVKCKPEAFILTGSEYHFIEPRCMENHFKAAVKACDIQKINFHALRHTFATRCIELGFDVKSLSEILGHASVNITMNRYVHPSMELKKKNMDMLSELIPEK